MAFPRFQEGRHASMEVVNKRFGPKGKKDQKGPHSFSGLPTGRKSRECQWKVTGESPINMSMSIYSS